MPQMFSLYEQFLERADLLIRLADEGVVHALVRLSCL
jgi:hypothetical protein